MKKSLKIIKGNKIFWPLPEKKNGGWSIFLDGGVVIFGVSGGYLTPRDPPVSMYGPDNEVSGDTCQQRKEYKNRNDVSVSCSLQISVMIVSKS